MVRGFEGAFKGKGGNAKANFQRSKGQGNAKEQIPTFKGGEAGLPPGLGSWLLAFPAGFYGTTAASNPVTVSSARAASVASPHVAYRPVRTQFSAPSGTISES